jgi:hypothetical protein
VRLFFRQLSFIGSFVLAAGLSVLLVVSLPSDGTNDTGNAPPPDKAVIIREWKALSGNRKGKVIFAQPPGLYILYLQTGELKRVPGVVVDGAKGRKMRGKTPRPSWSLDGRRFVYRYNNAVYVCDEKGNKTSISNEQMDCSDETRWSWRCEDNADWLVGPSKERNVILVKISDPTVLKTSYNGGDVEKHCEITGQGNVVYDDGSDIYVTPAYCHKKGMRISTGQSCRPCASPDDRAAWLMVPHIRYLVFDASTGKALGVVRAPDGEELYRLNWSNLPDYAVHMYGSAGNERMHVRKISTGEAIFIGSGWDPDLWIEPKPSP